jgi:putative exosortase-associated protein (TIGR04073 family)
VVAKQVIILLIIFKSMKIRQLLLATVAMVLTTTAFGDIQSPPGHHFNWSRKLSRGVGNILFGWLEYPSAWTKANATDGSVAAASDFLIEGTKRTLVRAVHGIYETATFPVASWKRTYRPTYVTKESQDSWWGYTQFAPELGSHSSASYARSQHW